MEFQNLLHVTAKKADANTVKPLNSGHSKSRTGHE